MCECFRPDPTTSSSNSTSNSKKISEQKKKKKGNFTVTILDEKIEGMAVAGVDELLVGGREPLKALSRNRWEVASELRVLRQDHSASGHEAVYERFLTHCL
jgi:hypothetical protein